MKRLVSILTLSILCLCSTFAGNFFEKRYFELQMNVPVNVSNNAIKLEDVLKKEVVIDLSEIAAKLPKEGLVVNASAYPDFAMNIRAGNVFVGMSTGLDVYERLGISKDLFDFIGKGNQVGESIDIDLNNCADVFFHYDIEVGVKVKKTDVHIRPAIFVPIVSMAGEVGKATFVNDSEGNIAANIHADFNIYSVDFDNPENIINDLSKSIGFDIGGSYTKSFNPRADLIIDFRIPVVPGKLNYLTKFSMDMDYSMNIMDFGEVTNSTSNESTTERIKPYKVNRPLKLNGYINYKLFGKLLSVRAGGGLGVYHPFGDGWTVYPEYFVGTVFNLADVLKFNASMEYTDRIFRNQLGATVNLRIVQVDAGASLQSADFAKSFTGTGYGAYAIVSLGF